MAACQVLIVIDIQYGELRGCQVWQVKESLQHAFRMR